MWKGAPTDLDYGSLQIVGKMVTRGPYFFWFGKSVEEVYIYVWPMCSYALGKE